MAAFILAYVLRFEIGPHPGHQGLPAASSSTSTCCRSSRVLVPLGFHLQGLYRLRRGRSRVDDFFAVLVGSILAVVLRHRRHAVLPGLLRARRAEGRGAYEVSQLVWAIFLVLNVVLDYASRELVREALERRWRAGIGLKRILIAGAGELGPRWSPTGSSSTASSATRSSASSTTRRRRSPRLPRACRCSARSTKPPRSRRARASTTCTSRCRSSEHVQMLSCVETPRAGMRRRQGGARPAAVHRAARAARGPRRRPGHQHQRRARCRASTASSSASIDIVLSGAALLVVLAIPFGHHRAARSSVDVARAGVLPAGAHGPRRQAVHDLQVPHRCTTTPSARPARCGRARTTRACTPLGRVAAADEPRRAAAALERPARRHVASSARGPSARTSSSSSSTAFRSTCCATR